MGAGEFWGDGPDAGLIDCIDVASAPFIQAWLSQAAYAWVQWLP